MADMGWSQFIEREDKSNWLACWNTAKAEWHTHKQAWECDNGSVGCLACPYAMREGLKSG